MLLAGSPCSTGSASSSSTRCTTSRTPTAAGCGRRCSSSPRRDVTFVCLSATVANAAELGAGCARCAAPTDVVVERRRPVDLRHHFALDRSRRGGPTRAADRCSTGRPGPERGCGSRPARARAPTGDRRPAWPGRAACARWRRSALPGAPSWSSCSTTRTCCRPSSSSSRRAACDDAVRQCLTRRAAAHRPRASGRRIRAIAEDHAEGLPTTTCGVLGYPEWLEGLEAGCRRPPRRPGPGLPGGGRGVLRRRAAPGGLRHRDAVARHQHAGPHGGDRALHQVRRAPGGPRSPRGSTPS